MVLAASRDVGRTLPEDNKQRMSKLLLGRICADAKILASVA